MQATCAVPSTSPVSTDNDGYPQLEQLIKNRVATLHGPAFTTTAVGDVLFDLFLEHLPEAHRQHYNCRCCRRFVAKFGGLVLIAEGGTRTTVLWEPDDVPSFFREAIGAMREAVMQSKVTGVFLCEDKTWGTPQNHSTKKAEDGPDWAPHVWTHLHGVPSNPFKHPLLTDTQVMAEKLQDFIMLEAGLKEYKQEVVAEAVRVLEADALDRSEKTLGIAQWLLGLHKATTNTRNRINILWRAVALAPAGFCHVRSTMINTLLADIAEGKPFESVKRRWSEKMHPLQYQRPTAAPTDGQIKAAETTVSKLASQGSLSRRFARLHEIVAMWRPTPIQEKTSPLGGIFDHLKSQSETVKPLQLPPQTMTWELFRAKVLSTACKIEYFVPGTSAPYAALVTAADPNAPPILQWDTEPRNPVSWYLYNGGSAPHLWNLRAANWYVVTAICKNPAHWHHPELFKHHAQSAMLILDQARDTMSIGGKTGGGFFPETLRAEYHGIRSVMEAYAQKAHVAGGPDSDANGIILSGGRFSGVLLRVTTADGSTANYQLDRWE